ncbi:MAG: glycosyltransferase [Chitinophagales bacterium]|nr:glycosyltransferase [Chitinophagales bacterium]
MYWYVIVVGVLSFAYVFYMLLYIKGWKNTPEFVPYKENGTSRVSVIIAARNEERCIRDCLDDIVHQTYAPELYEIIVVDDFSEDATCTVVESFNLPNIRLLYLKDFLSEKYEKRSYKKKAIETAIQESSGDLIVTTDADCRMGKEWLATLVKYYEKKRCKMIIGPVLFVNGENIFEEFQALDYLGMAAIAAGSLNFNFPTLCNGANLLYEKEAFKKVEGYTGNENIASGDDLLLMHKIWKQWPGEISYIKNRSSVVLTYPQHFLKDFFSQRLRWASKSGNYSDWKIKLNLFLIYLFNVAFFINFFYSFFNSAVLPLFIVQASIKLVLDFVLLYSACTFFNRKKLLSVFLISELFHLAYITVTGLLGNIIRPVWKGRKI